MRESALAIVAFIVPLVWGYAVHWGMNRMWPPTRMLRNNDTASNASGSVDPNEHVDYQI
jgi:hypothetical protein